MGARVLGGGWCLSRGRLAQKVNVDERTIESPVQMMAVKKGATLQSMGSRVSVSPPTSINHPESFSTANPSLDIHDREKTFYSGSHSRVS